jgi:coenzyme F420-0:L-glutamate ligase
MISIFGIKTPLIKPGDNIVKIVLESIERNNLKILDKDILVFSAKIISTANGRMLKLSDIIPSDKAKELSLIYDMDPRFVEVVLKEADMVIGGVKNALLTIKNGIIVANAGVDQSNAPPGYVVLWPEDPQKEAKTLRNKFMEMGFDVCILITDSRVLPMRMGNSAIALGISGFKPIEDLRGKKDLYERPMRIKRLAIADNIASAALIVMGETSESIPVAIVRGAKVTYGDYDIEEAKIPIEECLIMHLFKKYLVNCKKGMENESRN